MIDHARYPMTAMLVENVLAAWPKHESFIRKSFAGRQDAVMDASEMLAGAVKTVSATVAGGMVTLVDDYRYTSEHIILREELHFRRTGEYRLKTFEETNRECYADTTLMTRYMNGVLLSNVLWSNHAHSFADFYQNFLPGLPPHSRLLEIGPGHGFYLHFAAQHPHVTSLTGWDVSPTSVALTRHALDLLGSAKPINLEVQNLIDLGAPPESSRFDAIVLGEVLEHVEDPHQALRAVVKWLRPGGQIWINVPANSPAPDHIYLYHSIEHAIEMVRACGVELVRSSAFPMTGATFEKAVKNKLTISCVLTGKAPDGPGQ